MRVPATFARFATRDYWPWAIATPVRAAVLVVAALLAGCATQRPMMPTPKLYADRSEVPYATTLPAALQRSQVVAAFDGMISNVAVAAGDHVQASQALLSLYPLNDLEIRARLPGRYQSEIQNALSDGQTLQAQVELPDASISLGLRRLAGEAHTSGIDAFFSIDTAAHPLRPGNLVELVLSRPPQERVLAVPFQAIYGNNRLFLLRDGRMHGIAVEALGSYTDVNGSEALLIRSDAIDSGAQIILTHLPNAVDGLKVKDVDSTDGPRRNKQPAPAGS